MTEAKVPYADRSQYGFSDFVYGSGLLACFTGGWLCLLQPITPLITNTGKNGAIRVTKVDVQAGSV